MKIQQLRYLNEIVKHKLNISRAAQSLHTSQPGISKQISLLEKELGVPMFNRSGKHLSTLTEPGEQIHKLGTEILEKVNVIRSLADEFKNDTSGSLTIATTHTQSRYMLPATIKQFIDSYPHVSLHMHQGSPTQISELAVQGTADFAIATEGLELFDDLVMMPCFTWNRSILVTSDHPLCQVSTLTLEDVARYPIVTYVYGFTGRSKLDAAFNQAGLEPRVVFTAVDADVIKTYVRLGLGIGIVASMAVEDNRDQDLVALDASHLFDYSTTSIGFRKETYLRRYMLDFIEMFAPHLKNELVNDVQAMKSAQQRKEFFKSIEIPVF